jgi:2-iminobutanoate/2-iminopropanoate deaminase
MAALRQVVSGADLPPAIGPYSQAVRARDLLFVSGQPGVDPRTGEAAGTTFAEQTAQAFRNLEAVLRAGGAGPTSSSARPSSSPTPARFGELNQLYAEFFPRDPPARMTMQVPLPRGLLVSIGCTAIVES